MKTLILTIWRRFFGPLPHVTNRSTPSTSRGGCAAIRLRPKEGGSAATHTGSAAIIDACRPYQWMDKFPRTTDISEELVKKTVEKWGKIFAQRG